MGKKPVGQPNNQEDWRYRTQEKAIYLLTEASLTYQEIANRCEIAYETLYLWRQDEDFKARLQARHEELDRQMFNLALTRKRDRVKRLQDLADGFAQVIIERGEQLGEVEGAAGGGTGLIVRHYKAIGAGPNAYEVSEYEADTGLTRELRELQKMIAQELGQWNEKSSVEVSGGVLREYVLVTEDEDQEVTVADLDASTGDIEAGS